VFTPEDVDFLKDASGQIAIAIENCLAHKKAPGSAGGYLLFDAPQSNIRIRSRFPKLFFLAISLAEKRPASNICRAGSTRITRFRLPFGWAIPLPCLCARLRHEAFGM
jgi:hypothetical protein